MRKARDVSYRRKFDLKQVEKAQNKRQWILLGVVLSLLACLAVAGTTAVVTKHYMLLSAVVLVGGLLPMFFVFEYRRPQAREIVTLAMMTALCVVSGDADEQAEAAYRHFLESRGRKA